MLAGESISIFHRPFVPLCKSKAVATSTNLKRGCGKYQWRCGQRQNEIDLKIDFMQVLERTPFIIFPP